MNYGNITKYVTFPERNKILSLYERMSFISSLFKTHSTSNYLHSSWYGSKVRKSLHVGGKLLCK